MTPTENHWARILALLAVSVVAVLVAAYAVPEGVSRQIVLYLIGSEDGHLLGLSLQRFSSYAHPFSAAFGVVVSWLMSPLLMLAGYIFVGRILPAHLARVHGHRRTRQLLFFLLGSLALFSMVIYVTVMLPAADSIRCRGCEKNFMSFMLLVRVAGFWAAGVMLGLSVFFARIWRARWVKANSSFT